MRHGTTLWQDVVVIIGTVCAIQTLQILFGAAVAVAVAVTALIACLAFLYFVGKDAA